MSSPERASALLKFPARVAPRQCCERVLGFPLPRPEPSPTSWGRAGSNPQGPGLLSPPRDGPSRPPPSPLAPVPRPLSFPKPPPSRGPPSYWVQAPRFWVLSSPGLGSRTRHIFNPGSFSVYISGQPCLPTTRGGGRRTAWPWALPGQAGAALGTHGAPRRLPSGKLSPCSLPFPSVYPDPPHPGALPREDVLRPPPLSSARPRPPPRGARVWRAQRRSASCCEFSPPSPLKSVLPHNPRGLLGESGNLETQGNRSVLRFVR